MSRSTIIDKLSAWSERQGPLLGLGFCRIFVGFMVIRNSWGYLEWDFRHGLYSASFHLPYWEWYPAPGPSAYAAMLWLSLLAGVLMMLGYYTRFAVLSAFTLTTYHLFLNQVWYRHNRYYLVLSLFLLCFSRCERSLSIDAKRLQLPRVGPLWSIFLMKAQLSIIYLASAISKTIDPDWRSGKVLGNRNTLFLWDQYAPAILIESVPRDLLIQAITILALSTEFFLAGALWIPRMRKIAFVAGILFHGYIELAYSVLTFSYLVLGAYFLFADSHFLQRSLQRFAHSTSTDDRDLLWLGGVLAVYFGVMTCFTLYNPWHISVREFRFLDLPFFCVFLMLMVRRTLSGSTHAG